MRHVSLTPVLKKLKIHQKSEYSQIGKETYRRTKSKEYKNY
ncbi:hypothetical protein LEP1GSC071_1198 [Leptospira santarosai str. JET]|uniref:Uncharacterized protein n=1 Tax=Leptospira santarosai serovar Shermani str. LT 821 TaxID=758847 RepID=K8Y876_9LEPT|nr:hypothetical protein LEP1GSC071_1198 [Leptospira santarosai str. JET]EKT86792.1 hypothetical protein LSS_11063 [Leptospira santarosai serovar Shermani str. LT 821]EPG82982.1 hypothetical protein LEP1GSC048_3263 [Leptospira santarosai serovar Shermani str. 1342KT]